MVTIKLNKKIFSDILRDIPDDANKGTLGTLSVVAGSECFRGAATLCVGAALRTGTGIVRLVSVEKVIAGTAVRHPTCTYLPVKATEDGMISHYALTRKLQTLRSSTALLCGCGLGQSADTKKIVLDLIALGKPTVLDADALNVITPEPEILKTSSNIIVTPHIGEMSRLTGKSINDIKANRAECARDFSERYGCITVLKDDVTHISVPGGEIYESALGTPGLAKGGSGDVLAGFIGGFLAQGYTAKEAALLGNILHGLCASLCAEENGIRAMLPDQLSNYVPRVLTSLNVNNT